MIMLLLLVQTSTKVQEERATSLIRLSICFNVVMLVLMFIFIFSKTLLYVGGVSSCLVTSMFILKSNPLIQSRRLSSNPIKIFLRFVH